MFVSFQSKNSEWKDLIEDAYRRQLVIRDTTGLQYNQQQLERHLLRAA